MYIVLNQRLFSLTSHCPVIVWILITHVKIAILKIPHNFPLPNSWHQPWRGSMPQPKCPYTQITKGIKFGYQFKVCRDSTILHLNHPTYKKTFPRGPVANSGRTSTCTLYTDSLVYVGWDNVFCGAFSVTTSWRRHWSCGLMFPSPDSKSLDKRI